MHVPRKYGIINFVYTLIYVYNIQYIYIYIHIWVNDSMSLIWNKANYWASCPPPKIPGFGRRSTVRTIASARLMPKAWDPRLNGDWPSKIRRIYPRVNWPSYGKSPFIVNIYIIYIYDKLWFAIVMLVYQRVSNNKRNAIRIWPGSIRDLFNHQFDRPVVSDNPKKKVTYPPRKKGSLWRTWDIVDKFYVSPYVCTVYDYIC